MQLTYDITLDLATANSRKAKTWKNQQVKWSALLDRLKDPVRTAETMAEYRAMSRTRQAEIKDTGGFVGGYLDNGRRTAVRHRSVLCLDADYADQALWADWQARYGCAAAIYSTHKHTTEKPRLRLVVPLTRTVSSDEYQAIGRRVALELGIDKFDDTTYDPARLMYWPSCSRDGPYTFEYLDAPMLDPSEVLDAYTDWRDITSWPMSSRQAELPKKSGAKQGDPLSKPGLIGAFCRAYYPISAAIEAFVPTYQPAGEGRYTYTEGSTAAGVIVYDDKFTYSHHGTDPASGQTVNAWDLVRLHRFSALDADTDPTEPTTNRPSYRAMAEMAAEDRLVKVQIVTDRQAEAAADFSAPLPEDENGEDWKALLKITDKGVIASSIDNVVKILEHDPALAGCLAHNLLNHDLVIRKATPWRNSGQRVWEDSDDSGLRHYLEQTYGISSREKIFDAINVVSGRNAYHPVREYLEGCTWDGVPRIDTFLVDYMGAEDTPYTRAVTRKTLTAAVARIYRPGCKFDYMLVIRGRQGLGKSTLVSKLGGEWFSDSFTVTSGKEGYEQCLGVWIVEMGELAGMKKAEVESIKQYLSKSTDRFRPAYGRRIQEHPRQCIFVGTTNEGQFLRDATGNRRFWVVDTPNDPTRDAWEELTPDVIRLIWGEAIEYYRQGEPLYLSKELEETARSVQEAHSEENPKAGIVEAYLDRLLPVEWSTMDTYTRRAWLESEAEGLAPRRDVCLLEIWCEALGGSPERLDRYASKDLRDIMDNLPGWKHCGDAKRTLKPYGKQRYYTRRD